MKDQNCDGPVRRMLCVLPATAVFLGAVILSGCGAPTEDTLFTPITINSAAVIAQESNADYDNNVNGLISGATMMNWLYNWPANRPPGITGKLVILQTGNGGTGGLGAEPGWGNTGREFLRHDDINVFTYAVSNGDWVQTRSNGVVSTQSMVANGMQMDKLLMLYNIDPVNDMIVFVMGLGGNQQNMIIGRAWYMFRYWGIDKKNLAILNGGINSTSIIDTLDGDGVSYFANIPSTPSNTGTADISQIRVDNTALQASMEEMMAVAKAEGADEAQTTVPAGGAFILDARGNNTNEYNGVQYATGKLTADDICGGGGVLTCNVAFEGHIAGALPADGFDYRTLLDSANGYRYFPKDTGPTNIANLIADAGYGSGSTVYTYCRTTYRAMVTGIATGVILGYPTKFYDGGWIEWGRLAYKDSSIATAGTGGLNGFPNLPYVSLWRTDNNTVSWRGYEEGGQTVNSIWRNYPLVDSLVDPYATSANALIEADKAYKWGVETEEPGGGGGGGGNPCG